MKSGDVNLGMSLSDFTSAHEWFSRRLTGEGVLSGVSALKDPFSLFLVQCIIILSICRLLGLLGAGLNQPKVIFEIIGRLINSQISPAVAIVSEREFE